MYLINIHVLCYKLNRSWTSPCVLSTMKHGGEKRLTKSLNRAAKQMSKEQLQKKLGTQSLKNIYTKVIYNNNNKDFKNTSIHCEYENIFCQDIFHFQLGSCLFFFLKEKLFSPQNTKWTYWHQTKMYKYFQYDTEQIHQVTPNIHVH